MMSDASSFLYVPSPYTALLAAAKQESRKKTKRDRLQQLRQKNETERNRRTERDIQNKRRTEADIQKKRKKGREIDSEAGESEKDTLIKKKIKFSSCIRKFRMEQLQSHI
jgi:hypothetical protein